MRIGLQHIALFSAVLSFTMANNGYAQGVIEEITVTAQKRAQDMQDVPLSVSALSADQINNAGITRLEDLTKLVPTLTFNQGSNFANSGINIRGLGTAVFGVGVESSVATVIDGVVMARGGAGLNDLPDIERVEVLNGPQGTLFGKNASAGLLHVVTKRPNTENVEGFVRLGASDDEEYRLALGVSGPLSDKFAGSINAYYRTFDGLWDNVYLNETHGGIDSHGARAKLQWTPTDTLDVLFIADYSNQAVEAAGQAPITTDGGGVRGLDGQTVGEFLNENLGIVVGPGNLQTADDGAQDTTSENSGISAEITWDLGEFTFTSITAARNWDTGFLRDRDWSPMTFIDANADGRVDPGEAGFNQPGGEPHMVRQFQERGSETFSQEFRLASPLYDHFDYVVGLYYYDSEVNNYISRDEHGLHNGRWVLLDANAVVENTNAAFFGQLNIRPSDQLTLIAGFRVLEDEVDAFVSRDNFLTEYDPANPPPTDVNGTDVPGVSNSVSESDTVYRLGAQYRWNDAVMAYANYSTGFKGAAFNTGGNFIVDDFLLVNPIAPETSDSFEIGIRTDFSDSLQLNLTAYHTEFDNYHLTTRDLETGANRLDGVKKVELEGVDVTLVWYPTESLSFRGGVLFSDAIFADFSNSPCYGGQTEEEGCVDGIQDLSGQTLPAAPEVKGNLSARFTRDISHNWEGFVQLGVSYQDDVLYAFNLDPRSAQSSYSIWDLNFGGTTMDGKYTIKAYVNNLFDENYLSGVALSGNFQGGIIQGQLPRDRTRYFGINFDMNFGGY